MFAPPETFLITFCNQQASAMHSVCVADFGNSLMSWVNIASLRDQLGTHFTGVCGACSVDDDIAVCTQSERPVIAVLSVADGTVACARELVRAKDPHSLAYLDGYLYVVSTGTNEVYRIRLDNNRVGEEELHWQHGTGGWDTDQVHVNGLTVHRRRLISSCFGARAPDGNWGMDGKIFYLDSGEVICHGLNQPHSPVVHDNQLFFAESAAGRVHVWRMRAGRWEEDKCLSMPGYTRGITYCAGRLFIGLSSIRNISRSLNKALVKIDESSTTCIVEVNLDNDHVKVVCDLRPFAREIYDLVPLARQMPMEELYLGLQERAVEMQTTVEFYLDRVAKLNEELERRIQESDILSERLRRMQESLSWKLTAPLRALREVTRRKAT